MSRKHFREIAQILKANWTDKNHWSYYAVVNALCRAFKRDNERFDPIRFKDACGVCNTCK